MRSFLAGTLAISIAAAAVVSARQFPAPAGWKWITDGDVRIVSALDPPEGSWLFGTMAPGWHITTRPAVTLFEPSHSGRGRFALESEIFLFPGPSDAGFGVFIGGRDLESKGGLVAFLIRRDGSAAVESHAAGRITLLRRGPGPARSSPARRPETM